MPDISTDNFMSRAVDSVTLRQGRSDHVYFRQIIQKDKSGNPRVDVCLVQTPSDKTQAANESRLLKIMQLMEDGVKYRELQKQQAAGAAANNVQFGGDVTTSHALAAMLMRGPDLAIRASVDLSTGDADAGRRAFGTLFGVQIEPDEKTATLLFEDGSLNDNPASKEGSGK